MTQRYQTNRGILTNQWTTIVAANSTALPEINQQLNRYCTILEIQIGVYLPSLAAFDFVPDGTLDAGIQERDRRVAFNAADGIDLFNRIGGFESPLPFRLVNVAGGYYFDLIPNLGSKKESIFLNPGESLDLRISALAPGDSVWFEGLSLIWTEDYE